MIWRLNKIQYPVYNLGPGKRIGIWVQGCSIRCDGCINRSTWDIGGGKKIDMLSFINFIEKLGGMYDGITISGGEPFDQYPQLMAFCNMIRKRTPLNILCYSGYTLAELGEKFPDKAFCSCINFLVDGCYEKNKVSAHHLKGSGNQEFYAFENGTARETLFENDCNKWSLQSSGETIYMAGVPMQDEMNTIAKNLLEQNIAVELE